MKIDKIKLECYLDRAGFLTVIVPNEKVWDAAAEAQLRGMNVVFKLVEKKESFDLIERPGPGHNLGCVCIQCEDWRRDHGR